VIVPDSDVWTRPDLLQPVFALGKELETRGAKVNVLKLPPGPDGAKVGLDDYLCAHPLDAFHALPRLTLKHAAFSRTSVWWRGWVKRKEEAAAGSEATALDLLERAESVRILHPAQDVMDGVLWYGLPADDALVVITSTRQAYRADRLPEGIGLRHTEPGPSTVSRELAVRWLTTGESGSIARALDALADFLTRYVVLRERRTALWIAAWALATWCYRAFRVFPYLSIRSSEKRCGKSRLLGLLARVCFNASPVTAHPTEAQLYRSAARTGGVQLFDEVETLRGDKDRFDALITVLNVGFERGGVVTRLEKRGERFVEEPPWPRSPRRSGGGSGRPTVRARPRSPHRRRHRARDRRHGLRRARCAARLSRDRAGASALAITAGRSRTSGPSRRQPSVRRHVETSAYDHGQLALPLPRRAHCDLNVLPEGGQKLHQPLDGEGAGPSAHERGDVWLPDPEDLPGLGLREAALPDEAVDLQRQIGLELLALGMGESEIAEDVAAALLHANSTVGLVHRPLCLSRTSRSATASRCLIRSRSCWDVAIPCVDFFWNACST